MEWLIELKNGVDVLFAVLPWLIVIVVTQVLKIFVYKIFEDWLRILLCIITPFVIATIIFFVFLMPDIDIWKFIQNIIASGFLAIGGFSFSKGASRVVRGVAEYLKRNQV